MITECEYEKICWSAGFFTMLLQFLEMFVQITHKAQRDFNVIFILNYHKNNYTENFI